MNCPPIFWRQRMAIAFCLLRKRNCSSVTSKVRYAKRGYSFYYKGQDHVHIGNDVINGHAEGIDGLGRRWETYIPVRAIKTSNWFYYYWKAHTEVRFGVRWTLWDKKTSSFYTPGNQYIYISNDVWEGTVEGGKEGCWTTWYIKPSKPSNVVDFEHARAIDAFVQAIAHEKMHKTLWEERWQPGWVDSDGDGVSDAREQVVGLYPDNPNTFDLEREDMPKPPHYSYDEELYCSLQEHGKLGDKTKDWADDHGLNYGVKNRVQSWCVKSLH